MTDNQKKVGYISFGAFAVIAWILLFSVGLLVSSAPYRANLLKAFSWSDLISTIFIYTPTNVAILALLSAVVGGFASNIASADEIDTATITDTQARSYSYMRENPWNSMIRGFLAYLVFITGSYIASNDPFRETTPDQYFRLAGVISLLAFSMGYDPSRIQEFLKNIPINKKP